MPSVVIPAEKRVFVRVAFNEPDLRERVKAAGAYGNPDKKAWHEAAYVTLLVASGPMT